MLFPSEIQRDDDLVGIEIATNLPVEASSAAGSSLVAGAAAGEQAANNITAIKTKKAIVLIRDIFNSPSSLLFYGNRIKFVWVCDLSF
jgi:hypothetical protein